MRYWLVQCPEDFRLRDYWRRTGGYLDWWNMYKNNGPGGKNEIKKDDIVFVWMAKGKTKKGEPWKCIYARAKVFAVPGHEREKGYWKLFVADPSRVLEYCKPPYFDAKNLELYEEDPLLDSEMLEDPLLGQGTIQKVLHRYHRWRTCPLSRKEGDRIEALLQNHTARVPYQPSPWPHP